MITCRRMHRFVGAALAAAGLLTASGAKGWGAPHGTITRAALDTLPAWQHQLLGKEEQPLASLYCIIPDLVYTRKDLAPYAALDSQPGVVYLVNLHLPAAPADNYALLRAFLGKAVVSLQTNNVADAARYAGTVAHMLEDWGCPAHSVPNDNMFTLFKQFLPPPDAYRCKPLHGPIEGGVFGVALDGRRPQHLMGITADEAAFNLLSRSQAATVFARSQVIPIIQALYAGNTNASNAAQQKAAVKDAALVADALYTLCCIGRGIFDPAERAALDSVDLTAFAPLEAPNLYLPQTAFFSKPNWGCATFGCSSLNGEAVPLKLRVAEGGQTTVKTFRSGIGAGTRCSLSYLVPPAVYQRFEAYVGLHAELGQTGNVTFEISGNGRSLARVGPVTGDTPAQAVDVALAGVTNLQLTVTSSGGDGSGNYAVWADPRLVKAPSR